VELRIEVGNSVKNKALWNAQRDRRGPLDIRRTSDSHTCACYRDRNPEICSKLTSGGMTVKAFYLNDNTARRVGYCFREGDKMILVDLESNVYTVSPETSAREAVRILLSSQQMIA